MIHVFHGFLGSPNDFSFLGGENVILHDLYGALFQPVILPDDVLIGYSMGGRIALELASKVNFKVKKIVLINSHPGLRDEEEKKTRKTWEDSVLARLENSSREDFFSYWNSLPIFISDAPLSPISQERFEASKELFHKFRLSLQEDYLPSIIQSPEKFLWIVGLLDQKYVTLAEEVLLPHDVPIKGISGGHRLFQHPEQLRTILLEEGIL